MKVRLSAEMAHAIEKALMHGRLVRLPGGYWTYPDCPRSRGAGAPDWHVGTTTIDALVDRGRLEFVEYVEGRRGRFPVTVRLALEPLSEYAIADLHHIAVSPVPLQAVNPGVAKRLLREDLVKRVSLASPYKSHHGRHGHGTCVHLRITDAGRAVLLKHEEAAR
jgi:hypothetical protein